VAVPRPRAGGDGEVGAKGVTIHVISFSM
jgi:hypothetical protein